MIQSFRDLQIWQKSMQLAVIVYRLTKDFPREELYGLTNQLRRASVSIPSNIAEGHGRLNDGHLRQFLATSRGSLFELQTQLELATGMKLIEASGAASLMGSMKKWRE